VLARESHFSSKQLADLVAVASHVHCCYTQVKGTNAHEAPCTPITQPKQTHPPSLDLFLPTAFAPLAGHSGLPLLLMADGSVHEWDPSLMPDVFATKRVPLPGSAGGARAVAVAAGRAHAVVLLDSGRLVQLGTVFAAAPHPIPHGLRLAMVRLARLVLVRVAPAVAAGTLFSVTTQPHPTAKHLHDCTKCFCRCALSPPSTIAPSECVVSTAL
jgi:hypothetical protein